MEKSMLVAGIEFGFHAYIALQSILIVLKLVFTVGSNNCMINFPQGVFFFFFSSFHYYNQNEYLHNQECQNIRKSI